MQEVRRVYPLGLMGPNGPKTRVKAGARVVLRGTLKADCEGEFCAERLVVLTNRRACRSCGSIVSHAFSVLDIRIAGKSQLALPGVGIPAEAFSEKAAGERLALDACKPGSEIEVELQNTDSPPWWHFWRTGNVRACLFGTLPGSWEWPGRRGRSPVR